MSEVTVRTEELRVSGDDLLVTCKGLVHEGNVRRIVIKNEDDRTLIDIPLTLGVVGALFVPQLVAIGAIAAVMTNATIVVEKEVGMRAVPRERTLYYQFGSSGGVFDLVGGVHNPYATGFTHQTGDIFMWEPLEFYSAFADEYIPWLASGHEFSADFTELTISIREGTEWSDGVPFTANDVAFTMNMILETEDVLPFSINIKEWIEEAKELEPLVTH